MSSNVWSLYIDESGRFEDAAVPGQGRERLGRVVGGILAPGGADAVERRWMTTMRQIGDAVGARYPWHAHEMTDEVRTAVAGTLKPVLAEWRAQWVFVVDDKPVPDETADLLNYVRMLGALVDLATRIAAASGATRLEVTCAQRSVPVGPDRTSIAQGFGIPVRDSGDELRLKPLVELEIRNAQEALRREQIGDMAAWPATVPARVVVATAPRAHPGVVLADLGTNRIRESLRSRDITFIAGALIAPVDRLGAVRGIDRNLRMRPAALLAAAQAVKKFEDEAAASTSGAVAAGAARIARLLWDSGILALAKADTRSIALALAGHATIDLAMRTGAYEGAWMALDAGWSGQSPLAQSARASMVTERETAVQLWRLTLECANHRGDQAAADDCARAGEELIAEGPTLALLAERLRIRNLWNVAVQNGLPAPSERAEAALEALRRAARALTMEAKLAADLVARADAAVATVPRRMDSADEAELWRAVVSDVPSWERPDREIGYALGTAARSYAFAGDLDDALTTLLVARSHFESQADLRFNATVIVRVDAERARTVGKGFGLAMKPALALAGCNDLRPRQVAGEVCRAPGLRFTLDAKFRMLLWGTSAQQDRATWTKALLADGADSLFAAISGLRSHPSELLARHAAELIRADGNEEAAQRWFRLSTRMCAEAPEGVLRRLGAFTERLAADPEFKGEGLKSSVLNPTFEYR